MWLFLVLFCLSGLVIIGFYWKKSLPVPNSTQPQIVDTKPPGPSISLETNPPPRQPFNYFLVLDVEATCVEGTDLTWPNEIIEWPVVLLTWDDRDEEGHASKLKVVDEFRSYLNPSAFTDIDAAPTFPVVLESCRTFLIRNGLICPKTGDRLNTFAWVTDGPFDIRDFVIKQCFISKITLPEWLQGDVIDSRKHVYECLGQRKHGRRNHLSLNLTRQLSALSLPPFEGRQHSGIDDTRNIARILIELARRKVKLVPNLRIHTNRRWYWMGTEIGQIVEAYFPESLSVNIH
ncbi:hypothetical protein Clacol_006446 [Clathrus columnatus]|uniref:Exonuclease domain-containing protein n=1 Tax=Clathrus columnatus TaxID=1419009 RepID=A0AAV5AJS4_9AGAM|nr:hypothetical protein Clacol_006446 [Clathrus columnatus]